MSVENIREKFINFMVNYSHTQIPSVSLIPKNDTTTLFTGSGMQPLISFLKNGKKHSGGNRLTNSQKCFRTEDIERVGDMIHTTFFEMLGNWSLGDYWKELEIEMLFRFLTDKKEGIGLLPENLYVTVFIGDENMLIPKDLESVKLWQKEFSNVGINAGFVEVNDISTFQRKEGDRIFAYGSNENWWSRSGAPENMPIGEIGGADTEVFFDTGKGNDRHPNDDGDRFLEIGNAVFIEYEKTENGFIKLPTRNVDFGGGLERLAMVVNGYDDIFQVDVLKKYIDKISEITNTKYEEHINEYRIIADHLRASYFLISDGITPSNTDKGYVLRKLIRRCSFQSKKLDVKISEIAQNTFDDKDSKIIGIIKEEEELFLGTLEKAVSQFNKKIENGILSGVDAFNLQSSFGLPTEMLMSLAKEKNIEFPTEEFEAEMNKHKDISRKGSMQKFVGGLAGHSEKEIKYHTATHLLHSALRNVLGDSVVQRGSNITPERLRFDFSYEKKLTKEQIESVEKMVNSVIDSDFPVVMEEMSKEEAIKSGAIGMFQDQYEDKVSVYTIGDFSKEFCGGPHVKNTGELGEFKIIKEESVSKGARRIKAILE